MQKNYIILAHKNPAQIARLISRLDDNECAFYIHVDKRVDIIPFKKLFNNQNTYFVKNRADSAWGDIGAVLATINGLRQILADGRRGYSILLSGQDYPIKSNFYIDKYLSDNYGINFINSDLVQNVWPAYECYNRLNKYKFNLSTTESGYALIPWIFSKEFYKMSNLKAFFSLILRTRSLNIFHVLKARKAPKLIIPYGGAQWWALTCETAGKILNFIDCNRQFLDYHRFSLLSDEIFFQSILNHLAQEDRDIRFMPSMTYVNWTTPNVTLPVTFSSTNISQLLNVPAYMLFARKFDINIDANILDQLDELNN